MTLLSHRHGTVPLLLGLSLIPAMSGVAGAQDTAGTTTSPTFTQIRKSALAVFLGGSKFDDVSELSLADYLVKEQTILAVCRPPEWTRQRAVSVFSSGGFREVQSAATWPGYTVHLVRAASDRPKKLDIVMFFFGIQKAGVDCKYTLGAFARRELKQPRRVLDGEERDALLQNVRTMRASLLAEMRQ